MNQLSVLVLKIVVLISVIFSIKIMFQSSTSVAVPEGSLPRKDVGVDTNDFSSNSAEERKKNDEGRSKPQTGTSVLGKLLCGLAALAIVPLVLYNVVAQQNPTPAAATTDSSDTAKTAVQDDDPPANPQMSTCAACFETKTRNDSFTLSICQHSYCRDCLAKSIVHAVVDHTARIVQCLNAECQNPIAHEDVAQLIDADMLEIYNLMVWAAPDTLGAAEQIPNLPQVELRTCAVCTDDKPLIDFYAMKSCGHADSCRECLEKALTFAIVETQVKNIKCLNADCTQFVDYDDIAQLLDAEMFRTFDRLLMETGIVGMEDAETCPNTECNLKSFHVRSADVHNATCPHCRKEFCLACKQVLAADNTRHECEYTSPAIQQAIDAYENVSTGADQRSRLEQQYGKRRLEGWIANRQTDRMVDSMKKCPQCRVATEKNLGCNHMTCRASGGNIGCGAEWCWLCGQIIAGGSWTAHFNGTGACSGRLFDGIESTA